MIMMIFVIIINHNNYYYQHFLIIKINDEYKYIVLFCRNKPGIFKVFRYLLLSIMYVIFVFPFKRRKFRLVNYIQYGLKPYKVLKSYKKIKKLEQYLVEIDQDRSPFVVIYKKL